MTPETPIEQDLFQAMLRLPKLFHQREVFGSLPRSEFAMLFTIDRQQEQSPTGQTDGIAVAQLARSLPLTRPAISKVLHTLQRKGYVTRYPCMQDRRMAYVRLSPQGSQLITQAKRRAEEKVTRVLDRLSESDKAVLLLLLQKLMAAFEADEAADTGEERMTSDL